MNQRSATKTRIANRTALLQALWKKALATGLVQIHLPSEAEATKLRFDLYNSVKAAKADPSLDSGLAEAANGCSVTILDGKTIQIKLREAEDYLLEAALQYGISPETLQESPRTQAEVEAKASAERMAKLMESSKPVVDVETRIRPGNKFYSREG